MSPTYPILRVDPQTGLQHEQMGSKPKFWYIAEDHQKWLFKRCRDGTGEDWAEKIAAEIAAQLGLPHAKVELAASDATSGCVVLDFAGDGALIHGNELLGAMDPDYPKGQFWHVTAHTVDNVLHVLSQPSVNPPAGAPGLAGMSAVEVFLGYLLLDALIGNVDRHHENWAILRHPVGDVLAPTYDHASSLGRELRDDRRQTIISTGVESYARRTRSALYASPTDSRPLSPIAAFWLASSAYPAARHEWLVRAGSISALALQQIIAPVHSERMSDVAKAFAAALVRHNQRMLQESAS